MLFGDHAGYAIEEAIYDWRDVSFVSGGQSYSVEALVPVGFEWVRNVHSRWNLAQGDALELDSRDGFFPVSLTPHKWLTYYAAHDFMVRRRGLNYTNIWLSLIKLNAWARWAATLEIWGLRNPIVKYDPDRWQDDKFKAEIIAQMQAWGGGDGAGAGVNQVSGERGTSCDRTGRETQHGLVPFALVVHQRQGGGGSLQQAAGQSAQDVEGILGWRVEDVEPL